jgi:Zn ribbon nucleic-acid-binding protein
MLSNGFIGSNSTIGLYSWGEPFLHPNFKDIINYLNTLQLNFLLSTNASKPVYFEDNNALEHLKTITFSMSGFSQESYDRIHGFNFAKIKNNIINIIENFRQCGFTGNAYISYHIYQFNITEIDAATVFAKNNNIGIVPYLAYFNGRDMFERYLKNELEYMELKSAAEELLLGGISKRLAKFNNMDKINYHCPQFDILTIGEYCNVLICCGYSDAYNNAVYKKIYDIKNVDEINIWRKNTKECKECISLGMADVGNNAVRYQDIILESQRNKLAQIKGKDLFLWGTGNDANKCLNQIKMEDLKVTAFVDSNKEKQGRKFNGYDVISPKELFEKNLESYYVVITSTKYANEIALELEKNGLVEGKEYFRPQVLYI